MKLEINLDIESAINAALTPEKLNPLLDKAISEAIKSAISDATGYSSEFQKTMKEQLKAAMPHGLDINEVAKFQHILNGAMTSVIHEANADTVRTAMNKAVKAVMPDVPARIKLSDLIKEARSGFHKEEHDAFYAYYQDSEYGGGGWIYLDDDETPGKSSLRVDYKSREDRKYAAKMRLAINDSGDVYALKLDGIDIMPTNLPDSVGSFDGLLLSMYVGRTSIEVDIDDGDVESLSGDQTNY